MKFGLLLILIVGAAIFFYAASNPSIWGPFFYPLQFREAIKESAVKNNLDPNFVAAVIYEESRFYSGQESRAGAVGLMQLLPATAESVARDLGETDFTPAKLLEPDRNVRYGTHYLRYLLDRFGDEELALAAYNAGETNVDQWRQEGREEIPFEETRKFVARVRESKDMYDTIYGKWYKESQ